MRILTVLGQKINNTGSGIVVNESIHCGQLMGDVHHLLSVSYPNEFFTTPVSERNRTTLFAASNGEQADFDHPIPGMSDTMPYLSIPYRELNGKQIEKFIAKFREKIDHIIEYFEPDLIHIHHLWSLVSLTLEYQIPTVVTIHGTGLKLLESAPQHKYFVERGSHGVEHFFSVSKKCATRANDVYNIPADKISVVGNGYNEDIFNLDGPVISTILPIILYAGKFVAWKGISYLLQACASIRLPFKLVIAGTGHEEAKNKLKAEVERFNIQDKTIWLGHISQNELAKWMRSATVFALPSIDEPFGLVLLEALACGCPIIAARTGGPAEFVPKVLLNEKFAELVPPLKDKTLDNEKYYVQSIANALTWKLSHPISRADKNLIHMSVRNQTWKTYYKAIRQKYQEVLSSPKPYSSCDY